MYFDYFARIFYWSAIAILCTEICQCYYRCVMETSPPPPPVSDQSNASFYQDTCIEDRDWRFRPFEPIRIKCFSEQRKRAIRKIFNETVEYFNAILLVRRSSYNLGISEDDSINCDNEFGRIHKLFTTHIMPNRCSRKNKQKGIFNADFVVYVREKECESGVLASAGDCAPRSFDGRPLFGRVSLCPENLNTEDWNHHALLRTLQHELLHAMGFISRGFDSLSYDEKGAKNLPGSIFVSRQWKVNPEFTRPFWTKMIVTPRVRAFIREHFGCPTLQGAEIENEGELGTAGAHWEKRIFGDETMTGYISRRSYLSELTATFFEDTKWYKVNYFNVDSQTFGRRKGCIFANESCRSYIDSIDAMNIENGAKPYCTWADYVRNKQLKSTVRECSSDHEYYSQCDFSEQNSKKVDGNKTYFADQWAVIRGKNVSGFNVYGGSPVTDGCPQWSAIVTGTDKGGDSVCVNQFGQPKPEWNWGAELFGQDSICLKQDGKFEIYDCLPLGISLYDTEKGAHGAGCYRYKCEKGRLMIQANYSKDGKPEYNYMSQYKVCWGDETVIHIRRHQFSGKRGKKRFHKGELICPPCRKICENNPRFPNFTCVPGIRLNSRDYSAIPCDHGGAVQAKTSLYPVAFTIVLSGLEIFCIISAYVCMI